MVGSADNYVGPRSRGDGRYCQSHANFLVRRDAGAVTISLAVDTETTYVLFWFRKAALLWIGREAPHAAGGRRRRFRGAPLGAARVQLGPGVVDLVAELHTRGGLPLAQGRRPAADPLRALRVTPGGLQHLLHRAARDARPAYEELREQVHNAPVVTVDETGWRVGAAGHWLWVAVTPTTTVYAICAGRGFDDAQAVLGADFDGVLVRDGWGGLPQLYQRRAPKLSAAPTSTM